jgi:hypothetical protein
VTKEQELRTALEAYVKAQGRMLDRWAEGDSAVKADLWKALHDCEEAGRKALANPCCEETPCQWGDHPCDRKKPISTLRAAAVVETMLNRDELRLLAIHRILDGIGGINLHERAADLAAMRGHEEPNDRDYLDATREALDVIVKAEFGV